MNAIKVNVVLLCLVATISSIINYRYLPNEKGYWDFFENNMHEYIYFSSIYSFIQLVIHQVFSAYPINVRPFAISAGYEIFCV